MFVKTCKFLLAAMLLLSFCAEQWQRKTSAISILVLVTRFISLCSAARSSALDTRVSEKMAASKLPHDRYRANRRHEHFRRRIAYLPKA